jgi:hypothetical protein
MAGLKTASNDPATTSTLARLDKVRGFVVDNDTGRPVSGVAVLATVELDGGRQIPIGTLASDAAGYVSFDLRGTIGEASPMQVCVTPVGDEPAALTLGCTGTTPSDLTLPFVLRVHGLGGAGCSGCEDEAGARPLAVQIPDLPAVQNPDLLDWRISPSSFAISRPLVLGDSTCQMLVPAEGAKFATNTYRFIQVVRRAVTTGMATAGKRGSYGSDAGPVQAAASVLADLVSGALTSEERVVPPAGAVRQPPPGSDTPHSATTVVGVAFDTSRNPELGQVLSFRQTWSPLTHSLGKIAYSLPLAPCESVNIAVIDWSRGDQAVRNDQAKSTENLVHSQRRDRSIDEAVDSALSESQGGWSLQAGLGGAVRSSASGTVPIEGVDVSMSAGQGLVGGFGYGTAQSWGERDLTGSSLQDLHDSIVQATSVVRQLNSTVVVQSSQQERNYVETRTVTNHNHCHALTVQYHEVLQHLQVDTRYEGRRWAVLIPYKLLNFDWQLALRYRTILETVLLDRRLAACFDAIFRLQYCQEAYPAPADKPKDIGGGGTVSSGGATKGVHGATPVQPGVTRYELVLGTGDRNTWGKIWVYLGLKDGSWKLLHFKDRKQEGGEEIWANTEYVKDISSGAAIGVDPTQIERIKVSWFEADGGDEWLFKGIRIRYQLYGQTGLDPSPVIDEHKLPYLVDFNDSWGQVKDWIGEVKPPKPTVSDTPMAAASDLAGQPTMPAYNKLDDQCCQQQLLVHLQANVGYYSRACWLLQDPTERVMMLDALFATVPAVRNAIDPTPLAINGNYVTYGFNGATAPEPTPSPELAPKRDIVSLPTRGLFAETHLSNCSACEQRDVTRFWNWEESP